MIQLASWKLPTLSDSNITRELTSTTSVLGCSKMNFIAWKKHGCFIPSHLLPFLYIGYIKTVDATYSSSRKPPQLRWFTRKNPSPTLRPEGSWRSAVVEAVFSGIFASVFAQKNPEIRDFPTQKKRTDDLFQRGLRFIKRSMEKFWTICFLTASYLTDVSKMCGRYW